MVDSNSTDLVEFNSSVMLSCSSSGFSPSFSWTNGSSEVTDGDRFQLSKDNSTLKIFNVTRSDQGLLRCQASNYFSRNSSDPVNLNINCEFLLLLSVSISIFHILKIIHIGKLQVMLSESFWLSFSTSALHYRWPRGYCFNYITKTRILRGRYRCRPLLLG